MYTGSLGLLLLELTSLPHETEWVEFKVNNICPDSIGEYLSALSNSATLHGQNAAYLVWGVENSSHKIIGTIFKPRLEKVGNQELENWLATQLFPRINFKIHEFTYEEKNIVIFEIPKATHVPVRFKGIEYIRVGTCKQKLRDFSEKERELWNLFSIEPFEKVIALENLTADEVINNVDYQAYFDLTKQPVPENTDSIINRLVSEKLIVERIDNSFDVTNLGGILFARYLQKFDRLSRKAIRVVIYKGKNKIQTQ